MKYQVLLTCACATAPIQRHVYGCFSWCDRRRWCLQNNMRARNHNTLQTTSISITNTNTVCCFCYYCSDKCIEKHRRDETGKQICIFSIEQQSWPIHQIVWEQIHWHSWRSVNASFLHIHVSHTYTEARRSEQSATVDTLIFRWLAYTMGDALLLLHCCHCIMYIWPSSALCAYIYIYIHQAEVRARC